MSLSLEFLSFVPVGMNSRSHSALPSLWAEPVQALWTHLT